jgi:hypothetical protein
VVLFASISSMDISAASTSKGSVGLFCGCLVKVWRLRSRRVPLYSKVPD